MCILVEDLKLEVCRTENVHDQVLGVEDLKQEVCWTEKVSTH